MPNSWWKAVGAISCVVAGILAANTHTPNCMAADAEAVDAEWPEFRGPTGQGHSAAVGLPLTWSETENIAWKIAIPGRGWSSPVIRGEQIWLTAADEDRKTLRALCFERSSGAIRHNVVVSTLANPGVVHKKNTLASPTPLLEGNRVYVHFGPNGTACLSDQGQILWKKSLPHVQGYGPSSSPVLYGDLLIVPCLGTDVRYLIALDKNSGELRWKKSFEGRCSEATPLVIRTKDGDQLISNQADRIEAFDPSDGKELWWVTQQNYAQIPRPVFGHGLVFVCGGYFKPEVWAIRPEGRGDVTESQVAWRMNQAAPLNPSPLLVGDELYCVSDNGIASCLEAKTGKLHWRERLGGDFSASPLFADGRIYFLNEIGVVTVVAPGPNFERLATNTIAGSTLASLSVAGWALYLRTDNHLFRIEKSE
jgi:outer membrane protein assembly factor BamB